MLQFMRHKHVLTVLITLWSSSYAGTTSLLYTTQIIEFVIMALCTEYNTLWFF